MSSILSRQVESVNIRVLVVGFRVSPAPLPLVGPTPLAGSRVWEGVVWEDIQEGRGVGVDEACVHPPQVPDDQNFARGSPLFTTC